MNMDVYSKHVREIIKFALNMQYLFGSQKPESLDVKLVDSFPKDLWDAGPDGKDYHELGENEDTYRGILEENRVPIVECLCSHEDMNRLSNNVREIIVEKEKLYIKVKKLLSPFYTESNLYAEFIEADIMSCIEWRICFGIKEGFWETVFQIYKTGGMPVGWSGKYPDGKFMVIYPGLKIC